MGWLRVLVWTVAWPVLLAAVVLGAAWWWSGRDTSLDTVLAQAARFLPAGQSLTASGVHGSLRAGGRIELLQWQGPGLRISARDVEVGWDIAVLLRSRVHLSHLQMAELRVVREAGEPAGAPFAPPQQLLLPVSVDIPFRIDVLQVQNPNFSAARLAGHYRFADAQHSLVLDHARVAEGDYTAQASLGALSPLPLSLTLTGELQASVPGSTETLALRAQATAQGPLSGEAPLLQVQARVGPVVATASAPRVQASATARIAPWAAQPLQQASAQWSGLNLASFWPELPRSQLSGNLQLAPEGEGWRAEVQARNAAPGPWDRQHIPVEQAEARLRYREGAWQADSATLRVGPGSVRASGAWRGATAAQPAGWRIDATLQQIDPARLHTRFASALLGGRARAEGTGASSARFDVQLMPAAAQPAPSPLRGLRLREVQAQGRWAAPRLALSTLRIRTDDALLAGELDLDTRALAGRGDLQLRLPGAQAQARGQLGANEGAGTFDVNVAQAAQATRWLAQWPGMPGALRSAVVQGQARLQGRWQGGWRAWPRPAGGAALQASLVAPRLDYRAASTPADQALQLRDLRADIEGPWDALQLKLQGEAIQGQRRVRGQGEARASRAADGSWTARVAALQLRLQDGTRAGPWTARLAQPLDLRMASLASGTSLQASAGSLLLEGPLPGTARVAWEPVLWQQQGQATRLRSTGRIEELPLAWIDALAGAELANLQLAGTLVFEGRWDLDAGDVLRLNAHLARQRGELSLVNEDVPGGRIEAGVREARLQLQAQGEQVQLQLRWDSERAGRVEANASTRFTRTGDGWQWAVDAPLAGTLRAQLPRVGVWSMLAPPGWRVRGTLDASAQLSGTRSDPQWNGSLQADDLALRSVVEGVELRDGQLRAQLRGRRVELTRFSLRGAPVAGGDAASGGEVTASGFAEWVPGTGLTSDVRVQARALRASLRADRRLVVSGAVRARTQGPRLSVQGALKADQALFVLPDETAPSLGSDVVIVRPQAAAAQRAAAQASTSPQAAPPASDATSTQRAHDIEIDFDMGEDFRLQGRGLSTRLAGTLNLRSVSARAGTPPRVTGELRTVSGSYRAYGQALDIERGVLRFNGAYDNPALDVLAIRPYISQRVGVQITGSALSPRIRLFAEPELPDAEKLAWLVLGRSAASGGAESAVLQQAALALLGGNGRGLSGGLASALGLDELSVRGASSGADGSTSAAAVTLGKRLTRNFYVAYERSLAGTLGSFYVFYDLSRRLTLRAQAGEKGAVDLIFTIPYD